MAVKGKFKPHHPEKYKGNPTNIIYRSSYELKFMSYLDWHPDVESWSSEEFCIPYRSKVDGLVHRYFPDFKVRFKDVFNKIKTVVFEVKPESQTKPPKKPQRETKKSQARYIGEVYEFGKNVSKWEAATAFCQDRAWEFKILTEKDLGILYNG